MTMTTTDLFLSTSGLGSVYGLFASDEPLQIRYVGRTIYEPVTRFRQHFTSTNRHHRRLTNWFKEVEQRGAKIGMRILGEYPVKRLNFAEDQWISFWSDYCLSLNNPKSILAAKAKAERALYKKNQSV